MAAASLPRRRDLAGWSTPHPELLAVLALGCLYVAVFDGHLESIDGLLMFRQGESIAFNHSLTFGHALSWSGLTMPTSKFGIGLSLAYLPGLAAVSWLVHPSSAVAGWTMFYDDPLFTAGGATTQVAISLMAAYLVAKVARALTGDRGIALWALALYGLGSPAVVYARGDFSQPLLGLCWMAGFWAALRYLSSGRGGWLALACVATFYAVLTRPVEGGLLLPGLLVVLWGRWREAATLAGALVAGLGVTLAVDWARFGSPLTTGYGTEGWTTPLSVGLPGALFSPARGILWEFPAVLLVPLGAWALARAGLGRVAAGLLLPPLALLLVVARWDAWWGGWDWGLRLFMPALPLIACLAAAGLPRLKGSLRRWAPWLLLLGGAAWAVPGMLTDILGGYGSFASGTAQSWQLASYPPIGAWQFLHHWQTTSTIDSGGVDILWARTAGTSASTALAPVLLLGAAAAALAWLTRRAARLPDLAAAAPDP